MVRDKHYITEVMYTHKHSDQLQYLLYYWKQLENVNEAVYDCKTILTYGYFDSTSSMSFGF